MWGALQERQLPSLAITPLQRRQRGSVLGSLPLPGSGAATFVSFSLLFGAVALAARMRPPHSSPLAMYALRQTVFAHS